MTAKVYKTVLLLCTIAAIALFSSSCAEKDNILLEEEPEEVQMPEEPTQPEPSWADGVVTITTGRYQTKDALIDAIQQKKNFRVLWKARRDIRQMDVPMSKTEKTVDITVVTLEEAGFNEMTERVTLEQVIARFRQLGYRPLTIEEALELRLQFEDQPDMSKDDLTEEERKWGNMWTLLSKQDAQSLCDGRDGKPTGYKALLYLYRASAWDGFGEGFGIGRQGIGSFDPHAQNRKIERMRTAIPYGSIFACAIID